MRQVNNKKKKIDGFEGRFIKNCVCVMFDVCARESKIKERIAKWSLNFFFLPATSFFLGVQMNKKKKSLSYRCTKSDTDKYNFSLSNIYQKSFLTIYYSPSFLPSFRLKKKERKKMKEKWPGWKKKNKKKDFHLIIYVKNQLPSFSLSLSLLFPPLLPQRRKKRRRWRRRGKKNQQCPRKKM